MNLFSKHQGQASLVDGHSILQKFKAVRQKSLDLCSTLKTEDFVVQPAAFVSPPKWNLAHVTWFFETFVLEAYQKDYKIYDEDYAFFFNSYYNSVGKRVFRADRGNMTRPTTKEVMAYRDYVDEKMQAFLEANPELSADIQAVIELGLNHEQQHQELLLTDIKYVLAHNPLFPAFRERKQPDYPRPSDIHKKGKFDHFEGGIYKIGYEGKSFHFDNEKGVHKVFLHDFKIMDRLITNAEYLEFMEDGGYQDFRHWLSSGWEWVKENNIDAPLYWHKIDGEWQQYSLYGLKKINPIAPITHVSYYEAVAFANWRGKRLPTEFEWEVACKKLNPQIPEGVNFLESEFLEPIPVHGQNQMYGDVWEWTGSAYLAYPYYQQAAGALGEYNGKFMCGQMVLRGGSCVTAISHIRPSYRNFFFPQERWQFTGIRLAEHI